MKHDLIVEGFAASPEGDNIWTFAAKVMEPNEVSFEDTDEPLRIRIDSLSEQREVPWAFVYVLGLMVATAISSFCLYVGLVNWATDWIGFLFAALATIGGLTLTVEIVLWLNVLKEIYRGE